MRTSAFEEPPCPHCTNPLTANVFYEQHSHWRINEGRLVWALIQKRSNTPTVI